MSSVFLLKDRSPHKRGEIISVPFGVGKDLIRDGVACYPSGRPIPPAPPAPVAAAALPPVEAPKQPEKAPPAPETKTPAKGGKQ